MSPSERLASRLSPDRLLVILAFLASLLIVALATHRPTVVASFGGGVLVLAALLWSVLARRPVAPSEVLASPDWSVTVAAIERSDCAIAIIDRAGRMVCANRLYARVFGTDHAPPNLPVALAEREALALATRAAWRDGEGHAELVLAPARFGGEAASVPPDSAPGDADPHGSALGDAPLTASSPIDPALGDPAFGDPPSPPSDTTPSTDTIGERWRAVAIRAGRAENFLIWRLTPVITPDPVQALAEQLAGKPGRALAQAGIVAAIVAPDGRIRCVSAGFARAATGERHADMAGSAFVSWLMQDEHDRIFWARDAGHLQPLAMHYLPIADPDLASPPDPDTTPLLMLVADASAGLGGAAAMATAAPQLEGLLAGLPLGLAMADRDGRLLFANAAFLRAAGREGGEPPTYPTDLVVREDKAALSDAVRRFALGPASAGDVAVRLVTQPDEPVSLGLAGIRGLGEAVVLLSLADSTEETRLKRQIAQATKMQAVGQLAGGVAHDFNNVLTAIIGTCDLMLLRHTPGDSDYDDIQQIRASSNRAASLTRQLLAFSRQQTLRPELLQLPDIVTEVSQMLRRLIGEKITLVVTHDRNQGPVRADPTQLEQVIVNLAVNARDAIQDHARRSGGDGSGRLALMTRRVTAADVRATRREVLPIADYTALVVEDSGGGIPLEHLGKIWEPFFTTKEHGKGTGLGLSTVYGIVKQSGGFIFAENFVGGGEGAGGGVAGSAGGGVGSGARFIIYLPVHPVLPGEAPAPKPREAAASWGGGGSILLVEDEDTVRAVAERALTRAGYTVTTASDGDAGLAAVEARRAAGEAMFDLVVSDVVMPAMDGPAMVRAIRKLVPELPVLFMSGYAEAQLRREIDGKALAFIAKPFSVAEISRKVAEVLARPEPMGADETAGRGILK